MAAPGTPWHPTYSQLRHHPKLKDLRGELKMTRISAVGLIEWIWCFADDYAPDGYLTASNLEACLKEAGINRHRSRYITALTLFKLLDKVGEGYQIHNRARYNKNYKRAVSQKKYRDKKLGGKGDSAESYITQKTNETPRGEERTREERRYIAPSFACADSGPPPMNPPSPEFLRIPLSGKGGEHIVTEEDVNEYEKSFPGIDAEQTLRTIRQWNLDNPKNRKTKGGIRRHIGSWLGREQNKAKVTRQPEVRGAFARTTNKLMEWAKETDRKADENEKPGIHSADVKATGLLPERN